MSAPAVLTLRSPAKINLFLAVTGRRPDGFHELVSVVAPLEWGDVLHASAAEAFSLVCQDPEVPLDETNLILRAAEAFRAATGWRGGAAFRLEKQIPLGAGLGGGSSNAVAALRALNELAGRPLGAEALAGLAAGLGSDCALFLHDGPVVMRGRGELVERLAESARRRLQGRRVLVFKPGFGISTAWAYRRMAELAPTAYLSEKEAEERLAAWCADDAEPTEKLLYNSMERVAFEKFIALPLLLSELQEKFGLQARMSGSGSACFALLADDAPTAAICGYIRETWGLSMFAHETLIA